MKHSLFLSCCLAVCASGVFPVMAQTFSNGLPAKQIVLSQKAREALKGKQILYIEREQYAPDHHNTATLFQPGEINEASFAPGGAMRVYDVDSGKIRTLIETTEGVVRDPEISFDGQKVLFSMRQHPKDSYHLYEMNMDGSGLRQLTFAEGVSDIDPIYLPDGNIIFTSTRQPKYCMCNRHIMGNLFRMEADGANITQIGVSTLFEGHASLLSDGRVLYDRWEYVDRNFGDAQGLWVVNPDGTKHAIYYGNNTASPGGVIDGRQIPNSDLVVCTFTSCHERPWGAMAIIDRRKGVDNEAALVDIWPKESAKWVGNGNLDSFKGVGTFYEDPRVLYNTGSNFRFDNHETRWFVYDGSCPYLFDEFGGVSFNTNQGGWGYGGSATEEEYYKKVASLVNVVLKMYPFIGGYCYTQLTDVELEQNGLYYYDRRPKFDIQKLREIFGKQPEM